MGEPQTWQRSFRGQIIDRSQEFVYPQIPVYAGPFFFVESSCTKIRLVESGCIQDLYYSRLSNG